MRFISDSCVALCCFVFEAWRWKKNEKWEQQSNPRQHTELTRHLFYLFQKLLILRSLQMSYLIHFTFYKDNGPRGECKQHRQLCKKKPLLVLHGEIRLCAHARPLSPPPPAVTQQAALLLADRGGIPARLQSEPRSGKGAAIELLGRASTCLSGNGGKMNPRGNAETRMWKGNGSVQPPRVWWCLCVKVDNRHQHPTSKHTF